MLGDNVDFAQGDEVAAMVSRPGGAAPGALCRGVCDLLEMAEFPISLLKLDDEMKRYMKVLCDMAAGRSF